ncbi:TetR/AcrR family transcriptional regulator [Gordonia amicalis]|uniref:TetR/AcrR family transcriptional regulator n=2 Tax=Gordoniaceae TaxID=85026 RepID=A0AAE4U9M0_9ACTN|nr:TetR/AcrR family transcriptional regulator [Gordonia amicalis]ATD71005.1 TetR/AcrR family transcriptional regulator [Gordonia sp. 1D]MCZ4579655.1 TetR/AcrR family transcriptional regulator [Gordonia amicalis]MDV6312468.1 TetR/AcrR family transcriptional regulator [Gordonia amicalis]MDV7077429.1 TetR/AcrR family transcriptional regulator [Gordonia amicalis]
MPRKVPRQERSQRMVARILDSCASLLIERGYDGVSTHRIAQEAEISPGSLYQYFPNKDAIVAMTVERMIQKIATELLAALEVGTDAPPQDQIVSVVDAALTAAEQNRELVRVLVEQMPRLGGSVEIRRVEERAREMIAQYLITGPVTEDPDRPPTLVWMAFQAVQQLSVRYVLDQPDIPRQEFVTEMSRLLVTLVAPPA